jgi:hypothetical protein
MAHLLLHGTLEATILEADHLSNPTRATGAAPGIFRKVSRIPLSLRAQNRSNLVVRDFWLEQSKRRREFWCWFDF